MLPASGAGHKSVVPCLTSVLPTPSDVMSWMEIDLTSLPVGRETIHAEMNPLFRRLNSFPCKPINL
jgi:hypothetical protein